MKGKECIADLLCWGKWYLRPLIKFVYNISKFGTMPKTWWPSKSNQIKSNQFFIWSILEQCNGSTLLLMRSLIYIIQSRQMCSKTITSTYDISPHTCTYVKALHGETHSLPLNNTVFCPFLNKIWREYSPSHSFRILGRQRHQYMHHKNLDFYRAFYRKLFADFYYFDNSPKTSGIQDPSEL